MAVGNLEDATAVAHYWAEGTAYYDWDSAPKGFEYVGAGTWRVVYAKDGVVYKVPTQSPDFVDCDDEDEFWPENNAYNYIFASQYAEYRNLQNFSDRRWASKVTLYEIDVPGFPNGPVAVIAMPYVQATRCAWTEEGEEALKEIRQLIDDAWAGSNVLNVDGYPLVVDAGEAH
jgi:hypothetical protein